MEHWPFLSKLADYTLAFIFGSTVAGYVFFRKVQKDGRAGKIAEVETEAESALIKTLRTQIDVDQRRICDLISANERLAGERNSEVERASLLQGKVEALELRISHLSDQVNELQRENSELHELIVKQHLTIQKLDDHVGMLLKRLEVRPCIMLDECPKKDWIQP